MLNLFVGQYKNEKTLIKFNMVRYTTMCIVLNYYCYMNSMDADVACTIDKLQDLVFKKSSFEDTEENRTMVQTTIVNMKMMGLLNAHTQDTLVITNQGKQAYIDQTYHLATANLYQANASRILSLIAIGVATPDSDVLRGLFQCVKYKTIMDAEDKIHGEKNNNKALLVIGGSLSSENQKVRDTLGITVIENIKC